MTGKRRFTFNLLQNICLNDNVKLLLDYSTMYLTRDTRIIGKCIYCENKFDKSFDHLDKSRSFYCEKCTKDVKFERIKSTMLDKYGVEYASQLDEFKDKMKLTTFEKYGCEYALQNDEIKQKIIQTNLQKYGTEYGFQNEEIKQKIIKTNLQKYNVEYNLQREEIKEKSRLTNLKKYGVEYVTQNPTIMDKATKHMYKCKDYTFPSGNIIKIQGYENYALDELLNQGFVETDIVTGCKNVPTIWYNDKNGKKRRHFVDIYITSQNKCIEVKSTWTAKLHDGNIKLKQKAAKELSYEYEIWVYDNKGIEVEHFT
jgi:uncharacterized protein YcfL